MSGHNIMTDLKMVRCEYDKGVVEAVEAMRWQMSRMVEMVKGQVVKVVNFDTCDGQHVVQVFYDPLP